MASAVNIPGAVTFNSLLAIELDYPKDGDLFVNPVSTFNNNAKIVWNETKQLYAALYGHPSPRLVFYNKAGKVQKVAKVTFNAADAKFEKYSLGYNTDSTQSLSVTDAGDFVLAATQAHQAAADGADILVMVFDENFAVKKSKLFNLNCDYVVDVAAAGGQILITGNSGNVPTQTSYAAMALLLTYNLDVISAKKLDKQAKRITRTATGYVLGFDAREVTNATQSKMRDYCFTNAYSADFANLTATSSYRCQLDSNSSSVPMLYVDTIEITGGFLQVVLFGQQPRMCIFKLDNNFNSVSTKFYSVSDAIYLNPFAAYLVGDKVRVLALCRSIGGDTTSRGIALDVDLATLGVEQSTELFKDVYLSRLTGKCAVNQNGAAIVSIKPVAAASTQVTSEEGLLDRWQDTRSVDVYFVGAKQEGAYAPVVGASTPPAAYDFVGRTVNTPTVDVSTIDVNNAGAFKLVQVA